MTGSRNFIVGAVAAMLVVSGCGAASNEDGGDTTADSATTTTVGALEPVATVPTTTVPDRADREPANPPEQVPPGSGGATVTGEVPQAYLAAVIQDAAARAGVDPADVTVITGQEMIWPDGSLGCAEPGGIYTQALVPGYWVIVEAGGAAYDYRLSDKGNFRLCESPFGGPGTTVPSS